MKKSILNSFFPKAKIEQLDAALRRRLPALRQMKTTEWEKIGEQELRPTDHLALLVDDTKNLIEDCGYVVPSSPDDRSKVERETFEFAFANLSPEDLEKIKSGEWRTNPASIPLALVDFTAGVAWSQNDPETLLYSAYRCFMASLQAREEGDQGEALDRVSLGAGFLVRATFSLQIAQRRAGGEKKQQRNPKAGALRESRILWEERERGLHPKLRTEDQFAMEVCRRWPEIASIAAIKKRSTKWRKEVKNRAT